MRLDHIVFAAGPGGLAGTTTRLSALLGEQFATGGIHPRFGTRNAILPLTDDAITELVGHVVDVAPTGVAVCLLHSYAHPAHEDAVGRALRAALIDVPIVVSSELWPEPREYERAMTAVVCALVAPVISAYLQNLADALAAIGLTCPVQLLDSAGDVTSALAEQNGNDAPGFRLHHDEAVLNHDVFVPVELLHKLD